MKLYVFLVNTGTTLTFDTELAVQNVADLKQAIQNKYRIAIQYQVLVVNGGECMAADRKVCSYSAGTGFLANQKRAENLKDPSVLPDLCLSHANQLMIMLTNHRKLLDIKQKCTTAKQELANNLQVRLK
ncbi:hypothetical protein E2320_011381 [Naja naja]|nr:hypothetical protein E2320_011381 [Naja naja]